MRSTARNVSPRDVIELFSSGCRRHYFEAATGWDYGVDVHRFESGTHSISGEDLERLHEVVTRAAASDPGFWSDHVERGQSRASRLLGTARSLSEPGDDALGHQGLLERFTALAEGIEETARPFMVCLRT